MPENPPFVPTELYTKADEKTTESAKKDLDGEEPTKEVALGILQEEDDERT